MKINFDYEFKDDKGNPIHLGAEKNQATLRNVSVLALLHGPDKDQGAKKKRHRYDLAIKIKTYGKETVLREEDVELLKEMIGVAMVPLVVGPAMAILEGQEPPALA